MVQLSRYRHRKDAKLSLAQIRAAHRLLKRREDISPEHSIRASRDADGSDAE